MVTDEQEKHLVPAEPPHSRRSRSVDWYSEGEKRLVEIDGISVEIGFVGRNGRRARISICAPAGATFSGRLPRRNEDMG